VDPGEKAIQWTFSLFWREGGKPICATTRWSQGDSFQPARADTGPRPWPSIATTLGIEAAMATPA
jgi:uncharacterized protein (DUF2126 family)